DTLAGLAGHDAAHLDPADRVLLGQDPASGLVIDILAGTLHGLVADHDVLGGDPSLVAIDDAVLELVVGELDPDSRGGLAVLDADDHVLRDVDQTAGEVPGVSRSQRGVRESLAGSMRGDEVLE